MRIPTYCSVAKLVLLIALSLMLSRPVHAKAPPIRLSPTNQVPTCVTPERLMRFLQKRNKDLIPRFRDIAQWYQYHGEVWKVRWDYAFFQMALETNFLKFRKPQGGHADARAKQNNFAGIGTTGGGVPGNSFPDVQTGVLAQVQHLVVYSGERLANPVALRTRLTQDIILKLSLPVARRRPVTFQDLSGRWAVDRRYGRSIEYIARLYRKSFCYGPQKKQVAKRPAQHTRQHTWKAAGRVAHRQSPAVGPAASDANGKITSLPHSARECRVQAASYGGARTLLIQSVSKDTVQFIALDVYSGSEEQLAKKFKAVYAPGGQTIASFDNRDAALRKAHATCKRLTATP